MSKLNELINSFYINEKYIEKVERQNSKLISEGLTFYLHRDKTSEKHISFFITRLLFHSLQLPDENSYANVLILSTKINLPQSFFAITYDLEEIKTKEYLSIKISIKEQYKTLARNKVGLDSDKLIDILKKNRILEKNSFCNDPRLTKKLFETKDVFWHIVFLKKENYKNLKYVRDGYSAQLKGDKNESSKNNA